MDQAGLERRSGQEHKELRSNMCMLVIMQCLKTMYIVCKQNFWSNYGSITKSVTQRVTYCTYSTIIKTEWTCENGGTQHPDIPVHQNTKLCPCALQI